MANEKFMRGIRNLRVSDSSRLRGFLDGLFSSGEERDAKILSLTGDVLLDEFLVENSSQEYRRVGVVFDYEEKRVSVVAVDGKSRVQGFDAIDYSIVPNFDDQLGSNFPGIDVKMLDSNQSQATLYSREVRRLRRKDQEGFREFVGSLWDSSKVSNFDLVQRVIRDEYLVSNIGLDEMAVSVVANSFNHFLGLIVDGGEGYSLYDAIDNEFYGDRVSRLRTKKPSLLRNEIKGWFDFGDEKITKAIGDLMVGEYKRNNSLSEDVVQVSPQFDYAHKRVGIVLREGSGTLYIYDGIDYSLLHQSKTYGRLGGPYQEMIEVEPLVNPDKAYRAMSARQTRHDGFGGR